MVKYIKSDSPPINDHEGGANVESDCEGDLSEVKDEITKTEKEEKTRAVFVTGSFSAYVRFSSIPVPAREIMDSQLEISILLPLHRRDLIRSPQIARF